MPQLHFSVDEATVKRIEREAKRRGLSVSRYLASIIEREAGQSWPTGYLSQVVGSCAGAGLGEPSDLPIDDVDLVPR